MRRAKMNMGSTIRTVCAAAVLAVAFLAFTGGSASAALKHETVLTEFKLGEPCTESISEFVPNIYDIAIDEHNEWIYVSCPPAGTSSFDEIGVIKRFKFNGEPEPFAATDKPYIDENMITFDPNSVYSDFTNGPELAVDNSETSNQGRLFVASSPHLEIFEPSGDFLASIKQIAESFTQTNLLAGVDVDTNGGVYLTSRFPASRVSLYNPAFQEVKRLYKQADGSSPFQDLKVDSTGALWTSYSTQGVGEQTRYVNKYEADQLTTELKPNPYQIPPGGLGRFFADPSPFTNPPAVSAKPSKGIQGLDVDLTNDNLYLNRGDHIETYSPGNAAEHSYQSAPSFGAGKLTASHAVAITEDHRVFASTESGEGPKIVVFAAGSNLPDVHTYAAELDEIGHEEVEVHGHVDLAGTPEVESCVFEYGTSTSYGSSTPCSPASFSTDEDVEAELGSLSTGTTYHYRVKVTTPNGVNTGIDRTAAPSHVLQVRPSAPPKWTPKAALSTLRSIRTVCRPPTTSNTARRTRTGSKLRRRKRAAVSAPKRSALRSTRCRAAGPSTTGSSPKTPTARRWART